jgi:ABC-type multidrug transport system fused ATPase/permease subunit
MLDSPLFYLTKVTWRFARENRRRAVFYIVLFALANSLLLFQPIILAHILNTIQEQGVHRENLGRLLASMALLPLLDLVFWCLHGPARVLEMKNSFLVRANYRQYLLSGTLALPMEWHTEHHSGDTIDKIQKGSEALYRFTEHGFQIIQSIILFFGSLIALAIFNLNAIYLVLVVVFIAIRTILAFDKKLVPQYRALNTAENKIAAKVYDTLSNISTVIILRAEKLLEQDIVRAIRKPFELFSKNVALNEWKWFSASMSAGLLQFFVLGMYIVFAVRDGSTVLSGTLFALFTYTNRINDVFFTFAYLYNDVVRERAAVSNAEEIASSFPLTIDQEAGVLHQWDECQVRGISFSYQQPSEHKLQLIDIGMTWKRGDKIAVIGESGSGKTTFLKLVRGLHTPQAGTVVLDGKTLTNGFISMSEDIALIPQDPEIFATTIRDNITMGVERDDREIVRYMEMARFDAVLRRLPRGLDSSVVERGVNLSGGEKQRLALTRGLMASEEKSILLLDESTSSVDASNEIDIYEHIFDAYRDKTVIASIHRLHLLRMFDMIYMFEKGSIVASGSFEELLRTSPSFAEQWEKYTKTHKSRLD